MRIVIDAYGGDNAPLEIVKGASLASIEYGCEITLTGNETEINSVISAPSFKIKFLKQW